MNNRYLNKLIDGRPYVDRLFAKIKADTVFYNALKHDGLTDQIIIKNCSLFYRIKEDKDKCIGCKNIASCPKELKGVMTNFILNEKYQNFEPVYYKCNKKNEFDEKQINLLYSSYDIGYSTNRFIELMEQLQDKNEKPGIRMFGTYILKKVQESKINDGRPMKGLYFKMTNNQGLSKDVVQFMVQNDIKSVLIDGRTFFEDPKFLSNNKNQYLELVENIKQANCIIIDHLGETFLSDGARDLVLLPLLASMKKQHSISIVMSTFDIKELSNMLAKNYYQVSKTIEDLLNRNFDYHEIIELPLFK